MYSQCRWYVIYVLEASLAINQQLKQFFSYTWVLLQVAAIVLFENQDR